MIDLRSIPSDKEDLDTYEVEHNFQSWSYQPAQSPCGWFRPKGYDLPPRTAAKDWISVPVS